MRVASDLGEKNFIRDVLGDFARTARRGELDDCVVIDLDGSRRCAEIPLVVYSIDHPSPIDRPLPTGMEWRFFGRWAAACTCNDVLAMGARPRGFSLDLAIAKDTDLAPIRQFYEGLTDVLDEYGAALEGGNVDVQDGIDVVCMCWGTVDPAGIIRRRGARPGDHIAVTTELGVGWASYLLRGRDLFGRLSAEARQELAGYNLMPLAPHRAITETTRRFPGAITSGMDLSDGLVEFLYTIGEASGHGAVLEERLLPASSVLKECAAMLGVPTSALALEYGFDMPRAHGYTIAPDRWDAVEEVFVECGAPLHRVGRVTEERRVDWISSAHGPRALPEFWDDNCRRHDAVERWSDFVSEIVV